MSISRLSPQQQLAVFIRNFTAIENAEKNAAHIALNTNESDCLYYSKQLKQAKKFLDKVELIEEILTDGQLDSVICGQILTLLRDDSQTALQFYTWADKYIYCTVKFYNIAINCLAQNHYEDAKSIYLQTLQYGIANGVTYNTMIDAAGKNSDLAFAKEVFQTAQNNNIANVITYNTMLNAATRTGDLALAKEVFQTAQNNNVANVITYNTMLNAAAKLGDLAFAKEVFKIAQTNNLADVVTYNTMIDAAGKNSDLALAKEVFNTAHVVDVVTYASMIDAAGKNGDLAFAKKVFRAARDNNLAYAVTYNSMIDAAGKNGDLDFAKQVFTAARENILTTVVTYASMIDAAGKNGDLALAQEVFMTAQKNNLANIVTYTNMIDAYVLNQQIPAAEALWQQYYVADVKPAIIDLHNETYGTAYCRVKALLDQQTAEFSCRLIIGKGLHSRSLTERGHPVYLAMQQLVQDSVARYAFCNLTLDEENSGVAYIKLGAKKPLSRPKLKLGAAEFTPGMFQPVSTSSTDSELKPVALKK